MKFQIQDGEIYATINQKDGMVSFEDNPEKYNSATMMSQLDIEVRVAMFTTDLQAWCDECGGNII